MLIKSIARPGKFPARRPGAFILAIWLLLSGCGVRGYELDKNCNLELDFGYVFDPPGEALLPGMVDGIRVYVFDQHTSQLADILRIGRDEIVRGHMQALMSEGTYTFVCWASDNEDLTLGGYFPVRMTDPASSIYTDIEIGRTTMDEFRMMLACDPLPAGVIGEVTPREKEFDDLFFSITQDVVIGGGSDISIPLQFIRNTNVLKVRIAGIDKLETRAVEGALSVFVTAAHERYLHNNLLAPLSRRVRFELPASYSDANTMDVDIKVQRLELISYEQRPVVLYIQDASGVDLIEPIDVIASITAAQASDGSHPYDTQEEIDKQYEFEIGISLGGDDGGFDTDVEVTVNGYDVEYLIAEVQ